MSRDRPAGAPAEFAPVASVASRLFDAYAEIDRCLPVLSSVLLVAPYDTASRSLGRIIEELHAICMIIPSWALDEHWLHRFGKSLSCVVIDEPAHAAQAPTSLPERIGYIAPELPVVLLTARHEALGAAHPRGVDAVLPKPVERTAIKLGIISATANKTRSANGARRTNEETVFQPRSYPSVTREGH